MEGPILGSGSETFWVQTLLASSPMTTGPAKNGFYFGNNSMMKKTPSSEVGMLSTLTLLLCRQATCFVPDKTTTPLHEWLASPALAVKAVQASCCRCCLTAPALQPCWDRCNKIVPEKSLCFENKWSPRTIIFFYTRALDWY